MGRVVRTVKELMHSYNVFEGEKLEAGWSHGPSMPHDRGAAAMRSPFYSDRTTLASIYTRLAIDVAMVEFFHARLDKDNDIPTGVIRSSLNDRLTLDSNVDQSAFQLKFEAAMTMFVARTAAIAPIDTTYDINDTDSYDIGSLRVGTVSSWYPRRVVCSIYDDREVDSHGNPVNGGLRKDLMFEKRNVALIQNPFAAVMNEPNGTLQRLIRKLEMLDKMDEDSASGKLDMIIQMPFAIRGSKRQDQAAKRRQDLRDQLREDELGIGYVDVTEKIIQLNRPINTRLPDEVASLLTKAMDELGLTSGIMNGSASPDEINAYYDRTIEPIATAMSQELKRKFLTKNARTRRESIEIYRDPLKLIPIAEIADTVDALRRNSVITANEIRPKIGYFPSSDPQANELGNPNMPVDKQPTGSEPVITAPPEEAS